MIASQQPHILVTLYSNQNFKKVKNHIMVLAMTSPTIQTIHRFTGKIVGVKETRKRD